MNTYEYSVTTATIWTSFDYGEVQAETIEEAIDKATIEVAYSLKKCNDALKQCDFALGFQVSIALDQIEVNLKKKS
jgi:hypothetical protein